MTKAQILAECKRIPECSQTFEALKNAGYNIRTEHFADMRIIFNDDYDCELFFSKYVEKYLDDEPIFTTNLRIAVWKRTNSSIKLIEATANDVKKYLDLNLFNPSVEDVLNNIKKVKELCELK